MCLVYGGKERKGKAEGEGWKEVYQKFDYSTPPVLHKWTNDEHCVLSTDGYSAGCHEPVERAYSSTNRRGCWSERVRQSYHGCKKKNSSLIRAPCAISMRKAPHSSLLHQSIELSGFVQPSVPAGG